MGVNSSPNVCEDLLATPAMDKGLLCGVHKLIRETRREMCGSIPQTC